MTGFRKRTRKSKESVRVEDGDTRSPQSPRSLDPRPCLSLDDEEHDTGETFTVKKTAASRRLARKKVDLFASTATAHRKPISDATCQITSLETGERVMETPPRQTSYGETETAIPDRAQIQCALAHREQERQKRNDQPDFIPLGDVPADGNRLDSRLDHDSSEDEIIAGDLQEYADPHIEMEGFIKRDRDSRQKADTLHMALENDEWEQKQLSRSGIRFPQSRSELGAATDSLLLDPGSPDEIRKRISMALVENKELLESNRCRIACMLEDISGSELLDGSGLYRKELERKVQFFADLSGFAEDFTEFLEEKYPILEALEIEVASAQAEAKKTVRERFLESVTTDNAPLLTDVEEELKLGKGQGGSEFFFEKQQAVERIFEDASEDFSDVELVSQRLSPWRSQHMDSFRQAFGAESVAGVLEIFLRVELLRCWKTFGPLPWQQKIDFQTLQVFASVKKWFEGDHAILVALWGLVHEWVKHQLGLWNPLSLAETENVAQTLATISDYQHVTASTAGPDGTLEVRSTDTMQKAPKMILEALREVSEGFMLDLVNSNGDPDRIVEMGTTFMQNLALLMERFPCDLLASVYRVNAARLHRKLSAMGSTGFVNEQLSQLLEP